MRRFAVLLVFLLFLAACGGGATPATTTEGTESEAALSGELFVFAAASLTDAFEEIKTAFNKENPDVTVTYNFGPSSGLADQIVQGGPADVFASANQTQMDKVADASLSSGDSQVFVTNALQIAVETGNPLGIQGLEDLARPDVTLVLAAPEVPAGQFAMEVLAGAGVEASPASLEVDVRAVLQKVALGEADAGIVYVTDVQVADDMVDGVDIPEDQNVVASYPIAPLANAANPDAAQAFVAFVAGDEGQAILGSYGFRSPQPQ
ncbi:MAG: molybdate ABC transporter substrate-binding protein [Egibacteraceae bacterium]